MTFLSRWLNKQSPAYENLDIQSYKDRFTSPGADHTLLDVRTPAEFAQGRIAGAVNIPVGELQRRAQETPNGKPIVVVCASGSRSKAGARILTKAGYTEVYNLRGGVNAWQRQRLPLKR